MVLQICGRVGSRRLLLKARSINFERAFLCIYSLEFRVGNTDVCWLFKSEHPKVNIQIT